MATSDSHEDVIKSQKIKTPVIILAFQVEASLDNSVLPLAAGGWWLLCLLKTPLTLLQLRPNMFYFRTNFAILFTIFMVYSTRAENSTTCNRNCGGNSLPYPFGFSEGCQVRLGCNSSRNEMTISNFRVQNVTSSSILANLPAKCNRGMHSMKPLFGKNFAPTSNNSFLVQNCTSPVGGCLIPPNFVGNQIELENCDSTSDNITCFTQQNNGSNFLTFDDLNRSNCGFLFTAIAIDAKKDAAVPLLFQTVELGWWLEGSCRCSSNASCEEINLAGGKLGYRCQCRKGYHGDGFKGGTGCQRG